MSNKDCVITIITHFLLKHWEENSKQNVETSIDLTSRNHYNAERAINIFMPAKTKSNALQWLQNDL